MIQNGLIFIIVPFLDDVIYLLKKFKKKNNNIYNTPVVVVNAFIKYWSRIWINVYQENLNLKSLLYL